MKKYISTFLFVTMLAVSIPMFAATATAQRRERNSRSCNDNRNVRYSQNYDRNYNENRNYGSYDNYEGDYNGGYNQPTTYNRHRKAINIGVATGTGAIIGALLGGRKGAIIGAAAGVAGGAIITAKQRSRNNGRYSY